MVAVLVLNAIPLARPARATGTDMLAGLSWFSGSHDFFSNTHDNYWTDGDDTTTYFQPATGSGGQWAWDLGSAQAFTTADTIRVLGACGSPTRMAGFEIWIGNTSTSLTANTLAYRTGTRSTTCGDGAEYNLTANATGRYVFFNNDCTMCTLGGASNLGVATFSLFSTVATPTSCNRYVSDFVHTVTFGYHSFEWKWISSFSGSWSFLRHDGNLTTVSVGAGTDPATFTDFLRWHLYDLVIGDATANGQAPWVLSVSDTGTGFSCTLSVADGDQGVLIPPLDAPTLTGVRACYNTTGHLCPAPLTGSDGEVVVTYTLGGGAWADVEIGPAGPLTGCGSYPTLYGPLEVDAGTYTTSGLTADPTTDAPSWAVHAFNNAGEACAYATVDYSDPGKVVEVPDPVNPAQHSCSITDFACELTNLLSVAESALVGPVRTAVNGVRDLMMAKQPFNYIVRAFNGVSEQLARASDAVTSTTDCPGVTFTVPMPSAYWPSGVDLPEWTVLKCADFEPLVSTTTYQTIRGVMDAGIYLFWGWAELRALRPRFVAAA